MESQLTNKTYNRKRRAVRVRRYVRGTNEKPRLCVNRTNLHIHVQLIDDENSKTLASVSTLSEGFKGTEFGRKNRTSARELGLKMAEKAKSAGVSRVVFDRGSSKYHGVVAALADGVREGGIEL